MVLKNRALLLAVYILISLSTTPYALADAENAALALNKKFRLVWLQDHGDGRDALAMGRNLVLYGYDSHDGRGERRLLDRRGSFYLPLFTPDGNHVIFSNRRARKMYIMEWKSGDIEELGDGVAVEIWQDTKPRFFIGKPRVWVYCFIGPQREHKNGTRQPLYRFPLDNPKKKELIWNKTMVAWSNLQLSRDGELIGGLFPWPHGGILRQKEKQWQRFGRGCWASLSPDNSKLLWIFDGMHRNVQIYDVKNGGDWKVNINNAPGINGFEVYHPRWSNHPRYFVMTGPYDQGEGSNKIGGGSKNVEIYIGQFDTGAKNVEAWKQITHNSQPDFYPELWIEDGEKANLDEVLTTTKTGAKKTKETPTWPVETERLVYIWDNMKTSNQLAESSPVGFQQCTVDLKGKSLHTRGYQLLLSDGWADSGEAGRMAARALTTSGQATIEFRLIPDPDQKGTILAFSRSKTPVLRLDQYLRDIRLSSGTDEVVWNSVIAGVEPIHLSLRMKGKKVELFVNGSSQGTKKIKTTFAAEKPDTFTLGDTNGGWSGILDRIALYDRKLEASVIEKNADHSRRQTSLDPVDTLRIEGRLLETSQIPDPDTLGAYSRALVINTYTIEKILEGAYQDDRILVAEWAVLDRQIIRSYSDESEFLKLERFSDHPELEGERQMMDIFEPDLEMYYRLPN